MAEVFQGKPEVQIEMKIIKRASHGGGGLRSSVGDDTNTLIDGTFTTGLDQQHDSPSLIHERREPAGFPSMQISTQQAK